MIGLIARVLAAIRIVCPSAADLAASSMPIIWPAPGRLSTTSFCARARAMMSVPPPAAEGTMKRTGFDGYPVWAAAPNPTRVSTKKTDVFIRRQCTAAAFPPRSWARSRGLESSDASSRNASSQASRALGRAGPLRAVTLFLDRRASSFGLPRAFLRLDAFGDVGHHAQACRPAVECQIERNDLDVNQLAVLLPVNPQAMPVGVALILESLGQLRHFLRRADLVCGHREELLPGVAVVLHRGFVYRQKSEGLRIHHPHRMRMHLEKGAVARFAAFERFLGAHLFGDVLADAAISGERAVAVEDGFPAYAHVAHFSQVIAS